MYALTAAIFSLFALASASPAKRATAEITYPHAATTWIIGHHHNVTWSTEGVDTSSTGDIFLAKGGVIDPTALITGVSVSSGRTIIVVPFVNPDTDYAVVANFSGQNPNFSDQFAIEAASSTVTFSGSNPNPSGTSTITSVSANPSGTTTTTVTFPSTTIVATLTGSLTTSTVPPSGSSSASGTGAAGGSSAASSASSASSLASSASSAASSLASSASDAASSLASSASSAASSLSSGLSSKTSSLSSVLSTATSPSSSTSSGAATSSSAAGVALPLNKAGLVGAAVSALVVVASGAFML